MQALQQQVQATTAIYQPPVPVQQQPSEVDVTELENLLHKIMESCTKDSISVSSYVFFHLLLGDVMIFLSWSL